MFQEEGTGLFRCVITQENDLFEIKYLHFDISLIGINFHISKCHAVLMDENNNVREFTEDIDQNIHLKLF